jgi:hypothetical protein
VFSVGRMRSIDRKTTECPHVSGYDGDFVVSSTCVCVCVCMYVYVGACVFTNGDDGVRDGSSACVCLSLSHTHTFSLSLFPSLSVYYR